MKNDVVTRAIEFAYGAHAGQVRPNLVKQPKIEHLEEVARMVLLFGGSEDEVVAAWLHDILEDTDVTKEEIVAIFGENIGKIVDGLTDKMVAKESDDILERKQLQAQQIAMEGDSVKIVKMADQISNVLSVLFDPPIDWTPAQCLAYVVGAGIVVDVCKPVHGGLYDAFMRVYNAAFEHYRALS